MFIEDSFYHRHGLNLPKNSPDVVEGELRFVKDINGRFVYASESFTNYFGLDSANDIAGCTDYDLMESCSAARVQNDDQLVLMGKSSKLPRFELLERGSNGVSLLNTAKAPLLDAEGEVIGVQGCVTDLSEVKTLRYSNSDLRQCIQYIQDNICNTITIPDLAERLHMSVSQFERKFKANYHCTPLKFVNYVRMDYACRALMSGQSISRVSNDLGFCDQSYFTKTFKSIVGVTPRKYSLTRLN